jgi:hypothetical protein
MFYLCSVSVLYKKHFFLDSCNKNQGVARRREEAKCKILPQYPKFITKIFEFFSLIL